jgi:uncharacterized protein YndB with AHSA1/START domain
MSTTGRMRTLDATRGAVRVEEVYDTDIDDLWQACTTPDRLSRWIARVTGDLHEGGTVEAVFTSTWSGAMRIEVCEAPRHLLLTGAPGTGDETELEAWLSSEGSQTRLVVEERGLPTGQLHFYGAGWQVHLEDLGRSLVTGGPAHAEGWSEEAAAPAWQSRWSELTPVYEEDVVDAPEVTS